MRQKFFLFPLLAAACLVIAAPALADLGPPLKMKIIGEPRAAQPDAPFEGQVEITAAAPGELTNFRLEGEGWTSLSVAAPAAISLERDGSFIVEFTAMAKDPSQWLTLACEFNGHTVRKQFRLSAAARDKVVQRSAVVPALEDPTAPGPDAEGAQPNPGPRVKEGDRPAEKGNNPSPAHSRNIRVYGRWVYQRSDGVTVGADGATVRVYDEDTTWDELLDSEATDTGGYYDMTFYWDPCFLCDGEPDIYVEFESANTKVEVEDATWEINYSWQTGTHDDYDGSSLNFGWLQPADEDDHPALHILTYTTRTWRWLLNNEGYDTPSVDVQWPDGASGAYYNGFWEEIHVGVDRQWREDTFAHEYGHHWVENYAVSVSPDYCNGICDSGGDCGHCIWCQETDHDAFAEGWPNWLADVCTRSYAGVYGQAPMNFRSQENLSTCSGSYDNPLLTEGFLGALCRDIEDSGQDSHGVYGAWTDRLSLGTNEIFDCVDFDHPTTPMGFLNAFKARFPSVKENLWETAKNCGYEIDVSNPPTVTNLSSPSHAIGSDLADPTVQYTWTRANDDASGVQGYGIFISGSAGLPSAVMDIGDVTTYTTPALAPGTYYFSIRTLDRAGRWGGSYASYGPVTIHAPEPANLEFNLIAGWDYVLVPRGTNDASSGSAVVPATLPGNATSTYWNVRGRNTGESSTSLGFQTRLYVDDVYRWWASWGAVGAGGNFYGVNLGPLSVLGGRHTFAARLDALDAIAETNETDNEWGHQFIWTPFVLTANTAVTRATPPDLTGGWSSVTDGSPLWYNCDGLRFNSSGWWNAVVLRPLADDRDYDLRLHAASAGAEDGFAGNIGWASRGDGLTDAVLVNRNTQGNLAFDVGVLNLDGSSGNYEVTHVTSSSFAFGDSVDVAMAANQMLLLREFYVSTDNAGPVSITVDIDPANGMIHALWLDETFATGDLLDYDASAVSDDAGRARLDVNVADSGFNCLVVYRDPFDVPAKGTGAITLTIEIQRTPPDFLNYYAAGWHSPLVPRPADDGTPASVPLPTVLNGNSASTYFNMAVRNDSPTGAPFLHARGFVDGSYYWWVSWGAFGGNATSLFNWNYAHNIRGGRHTIALRLDWDDETEEIYEDNNVYGEQYCWTPLDLVMATPVTRTTPPDRTGGWEDIRSGEGIWYNCDGLRMPNTGGYWRAVAAMPGATSNVDLRIHPLLAGVKDGFGTNHAYSGWGPGLSDYVLVDFNNTAFQAYDVGALRIGDGVQSYTVESTAAGGWISYPSGWYGPYSVAANRILNLHEVYLEAGFYAIRLNNVSGSVDWGITLHPANQTYHTKSTAVAGGSDWFNGPGEDEWITVEITDTDWYCLAVWKRGTADLPLAGQYRLWFATGFTDVPGEEGTPPAATALAGVHPNPFNPQTRISFDLAATQSVKVEVYDLHGTRVRTLVDEVRSAGRHEVPWDGRDESGRQVASGMYMARLVSGEIRQMQKMVLLK